jgi:hypothetical protein
MIPPLCIENRNVVYVWSTCICRPLQGPENKVPAWDALAGLACPPPPPPLSSVTRSGSGGRGGEVPNGPCPAWEFWVGGTLAGLDWRVYLAGQKWRVNLPGQKWRPLRGRSIWQVRRGGSIWQAKVGGSIWRVLRGGSLWQVHLRVCKIKRQRLIQGKKAKQRERVNMHLSFCRPVILHHIVWGTPKSL